MSATSAATTGHLEGLTNPAEVVDVGLGHGREGDTVVIVTERSEVEVRFANNVVTTNGIRRDRRIAVVRLLTGRDGRRAGAASGSGSTSVATLVDRAERDAGEAPAAHDASDLVDGGTDGDFVEPAVRTDAHILATVLGDLDGAFARARSSGNVLSGFAEHSLVTTYLGTTSGTRRRYVQPTGKLQLVARRRDGSHSVWAGAGTRDFSDVDLSTLESALERRMGWARRSVELPPGRYDTVLPPDAVSDLMTLVYQAADGREAEDGRSVFSAPGGGTKVGERLASIPFELRSDPAEPGIECSPFLSTSASSTDVSVFDNGLPLQRTNWIEGGTLHTLRYHRAGATQSGVPVQPPIDNVVLEIPGAVGDVDDLVKNVDRGLLLTCLWYIREVDPATLLVTGLTRDGVYLIERGEITSSVNNFRFNESPVDLLGRAAEAGRTQTSLSREWNEWFPRTAMPALRVPDFNMSSVSPAT